MRTFTLVLSLALTAAALSGCGGQAPGAGASGGASSPAEAPLSIETLRVELPRELDADAARAAMEALPEAMAAWGVEVGGVSVSFGTSYAATADALKAGGVDLAFLPAADLIRFGGGAVPLLSDGYRTPASQGGAAAFASGQADPDTYTAGSWALLCAAPTAYGQNLSRREAPTWEELSRARWGVLGEDSAAGWQCLELWLEDQYGGLGIADLPQVTVCDSWEALLRAAAAGEIDCFPLWPDLRRSYEALWTMASTRTDPSGVRGFGREASIYGEVAVLSITERLFSFVAAAAPGETAVTDPRFASALEQALSQLLPDPAEAKAALGAEHFSPVTPEDLNGLRRLLA